MLALLIAATVILGILCTELAHADETLVMYKTVPEGAAVQYVIDGKVVQSQSLRPGTYRLSITAIGGGSASTAIGHRARRGRHH